MEKVLIFIFLLTFLPFHIFAQSQNENEKIDEMTTDEKIDSIYITSKEILKIVKDEPLADKKYGIEINIFRLLFFGSSVDLYNHSLSGGFSLFDIDRNAEIAFPIFYSNPSSNDEDEYWDNEHIRQFTLDCHYRRFLGKTQKGFYISGFIRYANLRGYLCTGDDYWYGYDDEDERVKDTVNKIGIGVGIGFRIFSYKGFYWGTSLNLGRYLIGENNKFYDSYWYDNDSEIIFNFELLKFGWAF